MVEVFDVPLLVGPTAAESCHVADVLHKFGMHERRGPGWQPPPDAIPVTLDRIVRRSHPCDIYYVSSGADSFILSYDYCVAVFGCSRRALRLSTSYYLDRSLAPTLKPLTSSSLRSEYILNPSNSMCFVVFVILRPVLM